MDVYQRIRAKIKEFNYSKKSIYEIFQDVYNDFIWNNEDNKGESRSGAGSTIRNTKQNIVIPQYKAAGTLHKRTVFAFATFRRRGIYGLSVICFSILFLALRSVLFVH
jgi:hypothetical protein